MRTLKWIMCLVFLLGGAPADAHVGRHIALIVDTDVALDDVRSMALLAQSEDVMLLAVVTSDGACAPGAGARIMREILSALQLSSVPVARGASLHLPPPPWRAMSESLGWSEPDAAGAQAMRAAGDSLTVAAPALIVSTIENSDTDVIYLCLGPLTNLAAALKADSSIASRIASVCYSGSPPSVAKPSWNTSRDLEAARFVFSTGLHLMCVQAADADLLTFDTGMLDEVCAYATPAAHLVCRAHTDERVERLVQSGHFRCWDEMASLSVLFPGLFSGQRRSEQSSGELLTGCNRDAVRLCYLNLLSGDLSMKSGHRDPVVLMQYPTDPAQLRPDVQSLAPAIIERYGLEEWNAVLLTNEFHRHLGIYSVLGAKMGIRAREILGAGLDDLRVISSAGANPPLSCMTDGLQIATGASLGRGTITLDAHSPDAAAAVFIKGSKRLTLRLKSEIDAKIEEDIQSIIRQYGPLTPAYWRAVRAAALRYWLDMDRNAIFDEKLEESH
jgi:pyrimidine-specific ribonucleoside hydrolase